LGSFNLREPHPEASRASIIVPLTYVDKPHDKDMCLKYDGLVRKLQAASMSGAKLIQPSTEQTCQINEECILVVRNNELSLTQCAVTNVSFAWERHIGC